MRKTVQEDKCKRMKGKNCIENGLVIKCKIFQELGRGIGGFSNLDPRPNSKGYWEEKWISKVVGGGDDGKCHQKGGKPLFASTTPSPTTIVYCKYMYSPGYTKYNSLLYQGRSTDEREAGEEGSRRRGCGGSE